jgi:hypothetical protein
VSGGINDPKSLPANVGDMNIIIERLAHQETLNAALHQNPETWNIFVAVDGTLSGQAILQDFLEQVPVLANRVEVEILPAMTRDALFEFTRERKQGEPIYLLVYFQDAAGQVFGAEEIPRAIAAASPVPVYVAWDFQMDSGAVGGCVTSAFGHGQKAAQTLLERLAGNSPPLSTTSCSTPIGTRTITPRCSVSRFPYPACLFRAARSEIRPGSGRYYPARSSLSNARCLQDPHH